jgi:hypothetical protein
MIWHNKHQVFDQIEENYMSWKSDVSASQIGWSGFRSMQGAKIYSTEPSSTKSDGLISETGGSKISRSLDNLGKMTTVEPDD